MYRDLLAQLGSLRAVVVGDVMCDEYITGHATRVSPEAPVMVLRHESHRVVPGGAANVARNLSALGLSTVCVGVVGKDRAGELLRSHTPDARLEEVWIEEPGRVTTQKTRVLADRSQQVVRIDREDDTPIADATVEDLVAQCRSRLQGAALLLLSDYRKGVLHERVVQELIHEGHSVRAFVAANAKPESLPFYRGADLVSVNRSEASRFLGRSVDVDAAEASAEEIRTQVGARAVLVTLGEHGMVLAGAKPARAESETVEVADPAGAGDTTIAACSAALAAHATPAQALRFAAALAACVVRRHGVATPSEADLVQLAAR